MKIGIDARLINETGVGRYIRNLVTELGVIDRENDYVIFLKKNSYENFKLPNNRWQKRLADIPWHSVTEQVLMPVIFSAEKLDLLHIPYFNVPIFYPGKFIITIHDLTILHFDTGRATTLPWLFYKIRRLGYLLALFVGLVRSQKIIAVSEATKRELTDHFGINSEKIVITHEGVDGEIKPSKSEKRLIGEKYLLYVGNAYPHKNLERLFRAIKIIQENIKLVLVGEKDFFYKRLMEQVQNTDLAKKVIFYGKAGDKELINLYANAEALVFPSLMEGFGLPGLEAMAVGTPVVCSDIPVFHEIYGEAALYFDPGNIEDMVNKLKKILSDKKLKEDLIGLGKKKEAKYSWKKMAEETFLVFKGSKG